MPIYGLGRGSAISSGCTVTTGGRSSACAEQEEPPSRTASERNKAPNDFFTTHSPSVPSLRAEIKGMLFRSLAQNFNRAQLVAKLLVFPRNRHAHCRFPVAIDQRNPHVICSRRN